MMIIDKTTPVLEVIQSKIDPIIPMNNHNETIHAAKEFLLSIQ